MPYENKPNYYSVIPATVRYDKDLSPNAKLLYGEITALANARGYCWANNKYFMELYSLSERTIQNLIKQLSDKKYIDIVLEKNTNRKIFLADCPAINFGGGVQKIAGVPEKKCTHNNKNNNTPGIEEERKADLDYLKNYNWLEDNGGV